VNLKNITLQACVLKVLSDEITGRIQVLKDAAEAGFNATGTSQSVPELPDGTKVATASLSGGGPSASVADENALLAWVEANHPGELVTSVRPSYKEKLLAAAKEAGRPVDPATGEVVPGITVSKSTPFISLRFKRGGKDAIVAAYRAGQLADIDLVTPPALEGGEAA
jgi:hypothetical protein